MSLGEPVTLGEICVSAMPWAHVWDSWLGVRLESHLEMRGQWPMSGRLSEKLACHRFVFSYEKCSVSHPKKRNKKGRRTKPVEALMLSSNLYKSSFILERKTEQAGNENIVDNFTSCCQPRPLVYWQKLGWCIRETRATLVP